MHMLSCRIRPAAVVANQGGGVYQWWILFQPVSEKTCWKQSRKNNDPREMIKKRHLIAALVKPQRTLPGGCLLIHELNLWTCTFDKHTVVFQELTKAGAERKDKGDGLLSRAADDNMWPPEESYLLQGGKQG